MSLYQQIQDDRLIARKEKNTVKSNLLSTLLGDIQAKLTAGKENVDVDNEQVLAVILSFTQNIKDTLKIKKNEKSEEELEVLTKYLPNPLSLTEIKDIVININKTVADKKFLIRDVMIYFKTNHFGEYDSQDLKRIVQEL